MLPTGLNLPNRIISAIHMFKERTRARVSESNGEVTKSPQLFDTGGRVARPFVCAVGYLIKDLGVPRSLRCLQGADVCSVTEPNSTLVTCRSCPWEPTYPR
jgi:hypothetical protein